MLQYWKQASRDLTYFWVIHHMATLLGSSNVNIPVKMMAHHQHVQVLINSILSEWPSGVGWWWNYICFRANFNDIRGMASTCSLRVIRVDCSALKIRKRETRFLLFLMHEKNHKESRWKSEHFFLIISRKWSAKVQNSVCLLKQMSHPKIQQFWCTLKKWLKNPKDILARSPTTKLKGALQ